MRALTLRQPYAWLTFHGKNPENRRWATGFRGWFGIHAGRTFHMSDYWEALKMCERSGQPNLLPQPEAFKVGAGDGCALGAIVGIAELTGVLPRLPFGMGAVPPWRLEGQFGFELPNTHLTSPVPCSGARQFWRVAHETVVALGLGTGWRRLLEEADERFTQQCRQGRMSTGNGRGSGDL